MQLDIPKTGPQTINTGFSLSIKATEFITKEAKRLKISKSAYVTALIEAYMKEKK